MRAVNVGASTARRCAPKSSSRLPGDRQVGARAVLREIAEEAGTAKPKIYRHFTDKSDLFQAIGERLRDMLWAAIFPAIDISADPAREVIQRSVEKYVDLVDEHPNVCRFLIQGRFAEQSESTMRALNEGRDITLAMAAMFNEELREMESTAPRSSWPRSRRSGRPRPPPSGGSGPAPTALGGCRRRSSWCT